ncbi:MAG: RNA polymerase sigma factor [Candidatus Eisenbacteria bacterium]
MLPQPPDFPRWPELLARNSAELAAVPPAARDGARAALWIVLHAALFASLRAQAHRVPAASREDLEDIASSKALEILTRAEEGVWTPAGRSAHEIEGFVARVARNGLVDLARRRGREVAPPFDEEGWSDRLGEVPGAVGLSPDDRTAANEFVVALTECAAGLAPRSRAVWFQRVFLEVTSRDIAELWGVRPAHVDVLVQRARTALRACMASKGHDGAEPQPGLFAALWPTLGSTMTRAGQRTQAREDERSDV